MIHITDWGYDYPHGPDEGFSYSSDSSIWPQDIAIEPEKAQIRYSGETPYGYHHVQTTSGKEITVLYFWKQDLDQKNHNKKIQGIITTDEALNWEQTVVAITLTDTDFARHILSQRKKQPLKTLDIDGAWVLASDADAENRTTFETIVATTRARIAHATHTWPIPAMEIDGRHIQIYTFPSAEARDKKMKRVTETSNNDVIIGLVVPEK